MELNGTCTNVALDDTSEEHNWISIDPVAAEMNGEDKYVLEALLRLNEWNSSSAK